MFSAEDSNRRRFGPTLQEASENEADNLGERASPNPTSCSAQDRETVMVRRRWARGSLAATNVALNRPFRARKVAFRGRHRVGRVVKSDRSTTPLTPLRLRTFPGSDGIET